MVNIRTVPFILFLISASRADVNVTLRCSNSSETSLTFEPSEDNVKGQYKVEWCLQANRNVTKWELTLKYNDHIEQSKCQNNASDHIGTMHSYFQEPNITISLNCEQVCLSTVLDLMFNACYLVQTFLNINSKVSSRYHNVYYIANNFTKEYFNSIPHTFEPLYEDGKLVINWFLGNVPATDISMGIFEDNHNDDPRSYEVTHTVSGVQRDVVTSWAVVPPRCYRAYLRHNEPWTSCAFFERIVHIEDKFCQRAPGVAEASSSPEGALRVLAGVTAAAVVIALVLLAVWRHRPLSWQRRVRDHWLKAARSPPPQPPCVDGAILLLYARDCASFVRVAERLAVLVRSATGCQVIDVYNGESMRLWAPAGDEWLRLLMSREDTRVLLLQSPAGALLAAELSDTRAGPALSAPLLGSRVMWRRPHAGDSLLSMALRLMSAAPSPSPYRKYYVAGISGLGAEMAPGVTPQRRYTLPEAVLCLLRDLAPGLNLVPGCDLTPGLNSVAPGLEHTELEPLLRQFKEVADAFADHVREHPDYLADELLFN